MAASQAIGKYGFRETNERGETLIGFYEKHPFRIISTLFKQL